MTNLLQSKIICYPLKLTWICILMVIVGPHHFFSPLAAYGQDAAETALQFSRAVRNENLKIATISMEKLAKVPPETLKKQLAAEADAKAFWLNMYNATVQYRLKQDPELFRDRDVFFTTRSITVAGNHLSLDNIEHGILRRSAHKYSFGYFTRFFISDFEEDFRMQTVDYRIHFALNCGARSCPPVALYVAGRLDEQLELATQSYLKNSVRYDPSGVVWVPALCSWFRGDFGGDTGVLTMLRRYDLIPAGSKPEIRYLPYDWTLSLSNYNSF